jgi:hypothetical protein
MTAGTRISPVADSADSPPASASNIGRAERALALTKNLRRPSPTRQDK